MNAALAHGPAAQEPVPELRSQGGVHSLFLTAGHYSLLIVEVAQQVQVNSWPAPLPPHQILKKRSYIIYRTNTLFAFYSDSRTPLQLIEL